ncbi:hypothetical protein VaNZ11_005087, partial [Volvox africanus]
SDSQQGQLNLNHCDGSYQDEGTTETIEGCVAALRCLRRFKQSQIAAAAAAIDQASYFDSVVHQLDVLRLEGYVVPGEAAAVAAAAESAVAELPPSETRTIPRTQLERNAA